MKKEYVKPYLALESFQLVAALAGSCGGSDQIALNQGINTCDAVEEGNSDLFGGACDLNIFDFGASDDGVCYNIFVEQPGTYLTS